MFKIVNMDSDCDPSEDSLNLHDLSGLDVELSSDSDENGSHFNTPKIPEKPVNNFVLPQCLERTRGDRVPNTLASLRDNVSKSLSLENENEGDITSDASFGLLSDGKLDEDNDDILGTNLGSSFSKDVHSPSSDKENTVCETVNSFRQTLNDSKNDTMRILGYIAMKTPVNNKIASNITPNSVNSIKKVSFSEKLLENSFKSRLSSSNSSDERISLSGVCDVPTHNQSVQQNEMDEKTQLTNFFTRSLEITTGVSNTTEDLLNGLVKSATTEDLLTSVSSRMNSSSTLKTDSSTSKVQKDIDRISRGVPAYITTDYSAVFDASVARSDTLSETRKSHDVIQEKPDGSKSLDCGGGDRKPTPASNTTSNDTFYKSFSLSDSRMQPSNNNVEKSFASGDFVTPGKLFQGPLDKESRSDFSNIEFSQDTSFGDKIFRATIEGFQSPSINLENEDVPKMALLKDVKSRTVSVDEFENENQQRDCDSSLTCLTASCESIAASVGSNESDHVISLDTIKETWPTLNSYMKAKEIAERFEDLCDKTKKIAEIEEFEDSIVSLTRRNKIDESRRTKSDLTFGAVERPSINATGDALVELSEYPLAEDSVFGNNTTKASMKPDATSENHVNFVGASFTNLSCISYAEGESKDNCSKLRGFSFSTPKAKSPSLSNSTSELIQEQDNTISNTPLDKNSEQHRCLDDSTLLSKYLKKSEDVNQFFEADADISNDTVVHSCSFPTVYENSNNLPASLDHFAKTTPNFISNLAKLKQKETEFAVKESDFAVDSVINFPDTIVNVPINKKVGVENLSDKWVIANFHVSNCRFSLSSCESETVASNEVFSVNQSVVLSPQGNKEFEVTFSPSKAGNFSAVIRIAFSGTADGAKFEKNVKVFGRSENLSVHFQKEGDVISALELNHELKNSSSKSETRIEVEIKWRCYVALKINCQLFCSIADSLIFSTFNGKQVDKSNKLSFNAVNINENSESVFKVGLVFGAQNILTSVTSVAGTLKLHIDGAKGTPIAELPISIRILRQVLDIPEDSLTDLVLKCDNDYAPLEFPISTCSAENVFVEMNYEKSVIDIVPNMFSLKPNYRQKIKVKAKHGNISSSVQRGSHFKTKVEIFSNGVKQKDIIIQIEKPRITCKRSLVFGTNAKCMLFRSPQIFSPVVETLKMENSTNEVLDLNVHIEKVNCFEISAISSFVDSSLFDSAGGLYPVRLPPKTNCKISVKFHSFDVKLESSYLIVRVKNSLLKYVIPLYGYSGRSSLTTTSCQNLTNSDSKLKEIVLKNTGYQDLCFAINEESLKLCSANPRHGVIKAQSEISVKVLIEHSQGHIEDLEINWGDYILKKIYDNCIHTGKSVHEVPSKVQKLVDLNFDNEASNISAIIGNISLNHRFLKHLDNSCFVPLDLDLLANGPDELPESERTVTSVSTVIQEGSHLSAKKTNENERWVVRPDYLLFKTDTQCFVLENKCNKCLEFVILTSDSVSASPVRGVLKAFEEVIVDVRFKKEKVKHKLSRDSLCVKIENEVKEVSLDFKREDFDNYDMVSVCSSSGMSFNISDDIVTLVNEVLKFPPGAKVGDCQQLTLSFTNKMSDSVKWVLSSVAPTFVKWNQNKLYKAKYAVFRVEKSLGYLKEKESVDIAVSFAPLDVGSYFQHWELHITALNKNVSKFIRVCCCGEARKTRKSLTSIPNLDETELDEVSPRREGTGRLELVADKDAIHKKRRSIVTTENVLNFPDVKIGQRFFHNFLLLRPRRLKDVSGVISDTTCKRLKGRMIYHIK